jgi:PAS domain S-box-containing protein
LAGEVKALNDRPLAARKPWAGEPAVVRSLIFSPNYPQPRDRTHFYRAFSRIVRASIDVPHARNDPGHAFPGLSGPLNEERRRYVAGYTTRHINSRLFLDASFVNDGASLLSAESLAVLEAVAQPLLVIDARSAERPVAHANAAFLKCSGYPSSHIVGREIDVLTRADNIPAIGALIDALRAGTAFSSEVTIQTFDARPLPTRISVQPVHASDQTLSHLVVTFEDLTRYSRLRESLRTSEPRLQDAMDASQLSMWDWNVEQDRISYNEQWRISLGVDPSDLLQRQDLAGRLMLPEEQPDVLEQFEQHFHGLTQCFECEYALRTPAGEMKWFAARAQVVKRDARGKAQRMIGVLRDISRRKNDLSLASEIQARWERAVRGTSDGLYDWDLLTGHVWYAARFREIVGYTDGAFPDSFSAFQNVLHADDRALVLQKIRKHLENQSPLDVRCRVVNSSGRQIWCRMRGQADRDAAGRPLRLAGSISDISAQIAAEEALGRSQNFYGTILDSLPFYIAYVDRSERVVYANRQFQEFFSLPLSNHRGRTVSEVLGRRRYSAIGPKIHEAFIGRTVESHGRLRNPSKQHVDIEGIFLPHFDEQGEIQGCFVAARDVTEKHQLEAELRQSQKMEAIGRLTGGLAHDFNNLLAVIVGNMQLLGRALRESPRLLRQTETALKAAMRGADLTRRLLAFARQQVLEPQVVDVNTLIGGMYELLRRSLTGEVEIRQIAEPTLWPVKIDPGQLENAILNLVINARDAMPNGGVITISTRNEWVTAPIADSTAEVPLHAGAYSVL